MRNKVYAGTCSFIFGGVCDLTRLLLLEEKSWLRSVEHKAGPFEPRALSNQIGSHCGRATWQVCRPLLRQISTSQPLFADIRPRAFHTIAAGEVNNDENVSKSGAPARFLNSAKPCSPNAEKPSGPQRKIESSSK